MGRLHFPCCCSLAKLFLFLGLATQLPYCLSNDDVHEDASNSKSSIGFCDREYYVPKSKSECSYGVHFGRRAPKCVCIKGIYRMYLDNCEIADGFAEEVCTLTNDTVTGVAVKGIRLTREPDFDQLALVCERLLGAATEWDYVTENQKVKITGTSFYTIHGEAKVAVKKSSGREKRQICVEKKMKDTNQICLIKHEDNVNVWPYLKNQDRTTEIQVKSQCPNNQDWTPLITSRCFSPLTLYDADCQVPCDKGNTMGSAGFNPINNKGFAELDGNCTDPINFLGHENNFIDRKLLRYVLMKALKKQEAIKIDKFTSDGLNKSYTLLEKVYKIAEQACIFKFLPKAFMQLAYELFNVILKGSSYQYEIKMSDEDFKWISDILDTCSPDSADPEKRMKKVKIYIDQSGSCQQQTRAVGYCRSADSSDCSEVPVKIPAKYLDFETKHYVPETVWLFMDIVHVACFDSFSDSYRMWHLLEQTIEKLFTTPIRDYWHNPGWSDQRKRVLLGAGVDDNMWNVHMCAESLYQARGNKIHRLKRPEPYEYNTRKKRSPEHLSTVYDVFCSNNVKDFKTPDNCMDPKARKNIKKPQVMYPQRDS